MQIPLLWSPVGCGENTETTDTASTATVPVSDAKAPREITYSVEKVLEEEVTDHEFNRNIRIFEIHTNSANRDKIEQYITYFPYSLYFQYINYGVPYEWQNLGMDAEIHEVDGILCAGALVCRQLEWEFFRLYSQCIYLDLENDVLLTYEEAAALWDWMLPRCIQPLPHPWKSTTSPIPLSPARTPRPMILLALSITMKNRISSVEGLSMIPIMRTKAI